MCLKGNLLTLPTVTVDCVYIYYDLNDSLCLL